jgi:hypothetical protein
MASKKIQPTTLLADKIERWTIANGVTGDPYLTQLVESLRSRRNLHIWAELNPMEYMPHASAIAGVKRNSLVRLLTILRNVLVFAPVALTWAAVAAATSAFGRYTEENQNSVTNFLDFWQNGYGYLADHWKIGHVAQLDFIMILIVIALTIFVSIASHKLQTEKILEEKRLDEDRAAIALEIMMLLHDKKKITPLNMNQAVAGSISRLVSATRDLEAAAKEVKKISRA